MLAKTKKNRVEAPMRSSGATSSEAIWASYRRTERREWWLWMVAIAVTLLLTVGVVVSIIPDLQAEETNLSWAFLPQAVRGLVGLVLLFDLYTIYQQWQIHKIRRRLFEREELFRLISENAADMIAVVDMEGQRVFNSLSYRTVLGYSPQELKETSSMEQIHPDDREKVKAAAAEARVSGVGQTLEYRMQHKNGTWRVFESTASVIADAKGSPEKFVIVNRDITERKLAQEALRLSDAGFRSVIEDAPYGICRATGGRENFASQSSVTEDAGLRGRGRVAAHQSGERNFSQARRFRAIEGIAEPTE